MADTHFLSSIPTLLLGGTVAASYTWLALRRVTEDPGGERGDPPRRRHLLDHRGLHRACRLLGAVLARVPAPLRARLLRLARRGCNLVFAYGCWRAHQAIFLLLPDDRRGRVRRWLAWTLVPDAPRPVRRLLERLGRVLKRMTRSRQK